MSHFKAHGISSDRQRIIIPSLVSAARPPCFSRTTRFTPANHQINQYTHHGAVVGWLVKWGFYALSASKAIFRARTYNCNLFSPVMMTT